MRVVFLFSHSFPYLCPRFGRSRRDIYAALGKRLFVMSWIVLSAAGLCETAFTFCLGKAKVSEDAQWWAWISAFGVLYVLSAVLLAKAVQGISVGVAYPVWTGIGAVGAVLISFFVFKEPVSFWKIFFLTTLIASVVGLKSVE